MGKSKQTISRKEYIDDDGWKVLELTAPNFSTVFKTRDNHCIYINNGEIIHEGPYTSNIKLSDFIDMSIDQFVDGLFEEDEVIDLEEVPKGIGTTYKYEPKKKKNKKEEPDIGCGGWGCGCFIAICLFILASSVILGLLGEVAQAIVQYITNLF